METVELAVEGMSCTGCEETVTSALEQVDGVHRVDADHEANRVEVTGDADDEAIRQAVHDAGFDVSA